jgi:hypothetical protein
MNYDPANDKRQAKRYLCDEYFRNCILHLEDNAVSEDKIEASSLDVTAINFSKEGMGLFCNEHIPESGNFKLSLSYENPSLMKRFDNLPCSIVYCNLTEVGSHCGIRFELAQLSEEDIAALAAIESGLASLDDPEDRYHLFCEE